MSLNEHIDSLQREAIAAIESALSEDDLERARVGLLGRRGRLTRELKSIKNVGPDQRPAFGAALNDAKNVIEKAIAERLVVLRENALDKELSSEPIDVTLPGRNHHLGALHPVSQTVAEIEDMFIAAGYKVVLGPEIEDDYHNFQALNVAENHPARTMQDTFYLTNGMLLRTHTSPVQVRVMQSQPPPIRIICPGRVFRRDFDRTHTPMFHQVEGLCVDEGISFANLKATVIDFIRAMFGSGVDIRFRPSYFPFTEPSAEVDVMSDQGWNEVMGCGMVHPNVLEMSGIDSRQYTGFAFGFGVDRLAMIKFGIADLRPLFENDVRMLRQLA